MEVRGASFTHKVKLSSFVKRTVHQTQSFSLPSSLELPPQNISIFTCVSMHCPLSLCPVSTSSFLSSIFESNWSDQSQRSIGVYNFPNFHLFCRGQKRKTTFLPQLPTMIGGEEPWVIDDKEERIPENDGPTQEHIQQKIMIFIQSIKTFIIIIIHNQNIPASKVKGCQTLILCTLKQ